MTDNDFINTTNKLIQEYKNNECVFFIEQNYQCVLKKDITNIYKKACEVGNVVIVDFLLNTKLPLSIDFDFLYYEGQGTDSSIKNGAIFLAGDDHHIDLLEYFIKNDIYYIDSENRSHLEEYMSSVVKIIDQIELKLYLEDKLTSKSVKNNNIKI